MLCLIVLWGFSLVTSYSGVKTQELDFKFTGFQVYIPPGSCGEGFGDGDSMGGQHAVMSPS